MPLPRIAFDTETELTERGHCAPRLACISVAYPDKPAALWSNAPAMRTLLRSYFDRTVIGHNVAFDFGVLCSEDESLVEHVFRLYQARRVRDTMIRQQLIDIREGRAVDGAMSGLDEVALEYGAGGVGSTLDKGADSWRYWYGDLMGTPPDAWPKEARAYAIRDAQATLMVFDEQQKLAKNRPSPLDADTVSPDETLQTRAAWCFHLMRMHGFRTDGPRVAELKSRLEIEVAETETTLRGKGLYKKAGTKAAPKWSKDMTKIKGKICSAFEARGLAAPVTEKGNVVTDKRTLLATRDPDLKLLAEAGTNAKLLNTFIPLVEAGAQWPITPKWNTLVRSGRTSCGTPDDPGNWQNPIKKGGIRECVIPREGKIFVSADYNQLELCTLAQVLHTWFGDSEMARAIQGGRDLHLDLATSTPILLGDLSYDEAERLLKEGDDHVDKQRSFAKVANFGFPGGLGAESFVDYALSWGIPTDSETAAEIKRAWLNKWPEMRRYFDRIARAVEAGSPVEQLFSGRVRGAPEFCSAANSMFQGLAADGAKEALWQITWKCFMDRKSPLYGSRVILFLHDEFILETPLDLASEAGDALSRIMCASMRKWTPDIPIKAEPRLMRRWYKKAKEVRDANGRLIPWEPPAAKAA